MSIHLDQLQKHVANGFFLSVHSEPGRVHIEKMDEAQIGKAHSLPSSVKDRIFQSGEALLSCTIDRLKAKSLRTLPEAQREELRDLVDFSAEYIKLLGKKFKAEPPERMKKLEAMVLSAKLGGKISAEQLMDPKNKGFVEFVKANHLHNKMQALGHECWVLPTLAVEGVGQYVFWSQFSKVDRLDASGAKVGYSYIYEGKEAFQTDLNNRLTDDYCYINGKICKYNPIRSPEVRSYDTQPGDGTYKVEIWTALHDVEGKRPVATIGDHSHLVLIDDKGQRFGVGQYGMADDLNCEHAFSACGRKRGGIETPDRYLMLPKSSHSFKKVTLSVSKEQYEQLMKKIMADKSNPDHDVSLIRGNCTSYVRELMHSIGVEVTTDMHVMEMFFRKLAPHSWIRVFDRIADSMPSWLKKAFCFFPLVYIPSVFFGLVAWVFSRHNINNKPSDVSLFDVIFKPWTIGGDHPFSLRRWQLRHLGENQ